MQILPNIPYVMQSSKIEINAMRGVNFSDRIADGFLADSMNISTRRFPYMATRHARQKLENYDSITSLTGWNALVAVRGTALLYNGSVVGTVNPGTKQFAVVNTKLVIWPDKVYLDLNTLTIKPLGANVGGTGASFAAGSVTVHWGLDLTDYFKVGDCITIVGCTEVPANNKVVVIRGLTNDTVTVDPDIFTPVGEAGAINFVRSIPDMDYICERENRLWGCSSDRQTIYASALGDPTNFNVFEGLSTDSYALAVGTDGDFTGCCKLGSSVLFWKADKLHKILGNYPAEYTMYPYEIEGLQAGSHKSLQVINETLYYMGTHGVFAYNGGTPSLISANFGERRFTNARAGNDGDTYYLSCMDEDGAWHLMTYEVRYGIWLIEDGTRCVDFASVDNRLYFSDSLGYVYQTDSGEDDPQIEWYAQFTPFYETIEGKKCHSKLLLRLELPQGSYITLHTRTDGSPWKQVGTVYGTFENVARVSLPLSRCDKWEFKMEGRGPSALLSFLREVAVESEV